MADRETNRREFLANTVGGAVAASMGVSALSGCASTPVSGGAAAAASAGGVPLRPFGCNGEKVSLLGVGGHHIGRGDLEEADSIRIMQEAIDNGATFMDNAWEYHKGRSEERMGKALQGRRDKAFVMT